MLEAMTVRMRPRRGKKLRSGFVDLGNRLRSYFDTAPDDEAGNEMQDAWGEFTSAAQRLGRSVTSAFQDQEVQDGAKNAFSSLVDAVGKSVSEAGVEFPWQKPSSDEQPAEDDGADDS